jgi:hypothetical protein
MPGKRAFLLSSIELSSTLKEFNMSSRMPPLNNENKTTQTDPLLELLGSGRDLWADEHADEYVRRLRELWEPPAQIAAS